MPWAFFVAGPYINIDALQKVKAGWGVKRRKCLKARKKRASNVQD